jgi:hypothetical protein
MRVKLVSVQERKYETKMATKESYSAVANNELKPVPELALIAKSNSSAVLLKEVLDKYTIIPKTRHARANNYKNVKF